MRAPEHTRKNYFGQYPFFYDRVLPLLARIDALLAEKEFAVLAIDGPSCAGKSTLAHILRSIYDGQIIPMDAFFLTEGMRTVQRLHEPGGNVHYERFLQEVGSGLACGGAFFYAPYSCRTGKLCEAVSVVRKGLLIVEGSYALHDKLRRLYDLRVFLDISKAEQLQRIATREEPQKRERFIQEFFPLEYAYHEGMAVRAAADFVLSNELI